MSDTAAPPRVTVVVANHNGERFIEAALLSALGQTLRSIEVVVVDDCSTDRSVAIVEAMAAAEPRLRLLTSERNGGPAAARNRGFDAARGEWIAVLDSDDLMHPERLERLVAAGEAEDADLVADNMLVFDERARYAPYLILAGRAAGPRWVEAAEYARCNALFRRAPPLGFLKPLFRAATWLASGVRYDPALRIAEDYDIVMRLLLRGARFRLVPELGYLYRKHEASISHRFSEATLEAMATADDRFRAQAPTLERRVVRALDFRRASIEDALAYEQMVGAVRQRDLGGLLRLAAERPRGALLLRMPVKARLERLWQRLAGRGGETPATGTPATAAASPGAVAPVSPGSVAPVSPGAVAPVSPGAVAPRRVCLISRQRVVGYTNGSSTYLLSLCETLKRAGLEVHGVFPSPVLFGRWPWLKLQPEMRVFDSISIRGGWRFGDVVVATDPRIALRAGVYVADRLLRRAGIGVLGGLAKAAPYGIGAPWKPADFVFVARHAQGRADMILTDYCFQNQAIPYALRPDAPSAVVMHDLFSSRASVFSRIGGGDTVTQLDHDTEMALLGRADAVIAIQAEEGAVVRRALPGTRVIVAPMAITPVAAPQPGQGARVMFVGSKTPPNSTGLRWFFDECWPAIRAAVPAATLEVAGSVAQDFPGAPPEGVRFLGLVDDLDGLYRDAAVVISPLLAGSGLKIKLIEAMGRGKAIVATPVTVQGVEDLGDGAVVVTDEPAEFAAAVTRLLRDKAARGTLAAAALAAARARFTAAACYAEVVAFARGGLAALPAADAHLPPVVPGEGRLPDSPQAGAAFAPLPSQPMAPRLDTVSPTAQ
ncbi:glycosyltransferase [Roseomonas sp. NAR14]|uniref:Glycosyltransferase n=1 Tax=Roseomonas acroporae TaxID=2937791 RepID=A0A9X1Y6S0_9PROT|nr:glycosyltransferase [Roseomonas acroporae]MCK8783245.1 glycosyltransferase [Roseomonas acroporae]